MRVADSVAGSPGARVVLEAGEAEVDPRPDLDPLRSQLARVGDALDGLLFAARDATSEAPICPRAAQRADVDRFGAEIRALLDALALSALIAEEPPMRHLGHPRRPLPVLPRSRVGASR